MDTVYINFKLIASILPHTAFFSNTITFLYPSHITFILPLGSSLLTHLRLKIEVTSHLYNVFTKKTLKCYPSSLPTINNGMHSMFCEIYVDGLQIFLILLLFLVFQRE